MSDIIKTQRSFAKKAMYNPKHRFSNLYRIICQEEWIQTALNLILRNKGAKTAGIDGVTKKAYASEQAKETFIAELKEELTQRRFQPSPVRRVYIPKANGKMRPL
jgi:retron-type reverse transcriptase